MSDANKAVLERANAAIIKGDNEAFLACCEDDLQWSMVGGMTLNGKDAVRRWMVVEYARPPEFTVTRLIAEGDFVVACGSIMAKNENGQVVQHSYCDVWRFRAGRMAELQAFVIDSSAEAELGDSLQITAETYREVSNESHEPSNNGNF